VYHYRAEVERVIDGDTVVLLIDLGLDVSRRITCRLLGIDAPEMRKESVVATESRDYLGRLLAVGPLECRTHKDRTEKYGRYLVELIDANGDSINTRMVEDGYAAQYG